jgi:two-component system LytT family response regulator
MKLRAVIVDDEASARRTLQSLIAKYCTHVEVVGVVENVDKGIEVIQAEQPDIVFLDIQMPGKSGFDLLDELKEVNFQLIFTTAFESHAIEAIRTAATDYLVKPIDVQELIDAVEKAGNNVNEEKLKENYSDALKALYNNNNQVVLPTNEGYHVISSDDIIFCEADRNYTVIHLKNNEKVLSSKTLKYFEDKLNLAYFFRVHKSYIVNLKHIKMVSKGQGGTIEMVTGAVVYLARDKKDLLFKKITGNS